VRLQLSKEVERDLDEIADDTLETWDPAQADDYVGGLNRFLRMLESGAARGRHIEGLPRGWRRATYRSHHIYYGETGDVLFVHRILHQRMHAGRHLRWSDD
jgi:toxin ParE1/3/4